MSRAADPPPADLHGLAIVAAAGPALTRCIGLTDAWLLLAMQVVGRPFNDTSHPNGRLLRPFGRLVWRAGLAGGGARDMTDANRR